VTVVLFFVWASIIGGVAPHIVSATRMAIRILRENIYPFSIAGCQARQRSRMEWRERCHRSCAKHFAAGQLLAWNIPGEKVFSPE
jgi:hypothetical protein